MLALCFLLKPEVLTALTTVLGKMLLQARDRHSHLLRQALLFRLRELPKPRKPQEPVTSRQELAFEPSMLRAAYRKGRKREHGAPVENSEAQNNIGAKKKQILFRLFPHLGMPPAFLATELPEVLVDAADDARNGRLVHFVWQG